MHPTAPPSSPGRGQACPSARRSASHDACHSRSASNAASPPPNEIGLSNALIWSFLGGILNIVPYFGPLIAAVVYLLVGFMQFKTMEMALLTAGLFVVVTSVEGNWLKPRLMSRAAQLNNVAVFASLLFWGWLWGAWGLLLAFPILMVVKVVADRVDQFKPLGELLGQ
jgi:predicted PurR-regulated permease PerM